MSGQPGAGAIEAAPGRRPPRLATTRHPFSARPEAPADCSVCPFPQGNRHHDVREHDGAELDARILGERPEVDQ